MAISSFMPFSAIMDLVTPVWVEVVIVLFFALTFSVLRADPFRFPLAPKRQATRSNKKVCEYDAVDADFAAGRKDRAVQAWRDLCHLVPTPLDTWRQVVEALAETKAGALISEVTQGLETQPSKHCIEKASIVALDVLARSGRISAMEDLQQAIQIRIGIQPTSQTYEVLLGGYAAAGDECKVDKVMQDLLVAGKMPTARGFAVAIKGFLKKAMIDAALRRMQDMYARGFIVPSFAVKELLRLAIDAERAKEIFDAINSSNLTLPVEALSALLKDCLRRHDRELASRLEQIVAVSAEDPPADFYDLLLKLYAVLGDLHALNILAGMRKSSAPLSESLCVAVLMRCADSKFVRLAEEVASYMRGEGRMTLIMYSALMKVYAKSALYDKACDLYSQILSDGLEPDAVMYGCLMRFAAECGRTGLAQDLFKKTPSLDIQNYMSQFRSAGRDKNLDRALHVFKQLESSGIALTSAMYSAAYNSVLDVCVATGDMKRARALLEDMRSKLSLNIVSYNTLLKGLCAQRDVRGAKDLMVEMENSGIEPNDISYNSLINACASSGDYDEAWNTIDAMEKKGVAVDGYTVSTMLKSLKTSRNSRNVGRVLALLDRPGIDVCKDEVLLNSVLDTCVWHQQHHHLEQILKAHAESGKKCSVSTYGSLIKAYASLKRIDRCRELWQEMTHVLKLVPGEVTFGIMLDALVSHGSVEEAVSLFRKWQGRVAMNKVMYSTLMKGFTSSHMPERAIELWREMRAEGIQMNTVVYNTVIDSQARAGAMGEIKILLEQMDKDGCPKSIITYSMVIKGYIAVADLDAALGVLRSMRAHGFEADTIIYNNLIDCSIKQNRFPLVDTLLEDMEKHGVATTNYTLATLVRMWGRRRQVDKAFDAFESLPKKAGFAPNAQAFSALMNACLANRDVDRAFEVFKKLVATHGADAKAYNTMLSSLVRFSRFDKAVALIEDAYGLRKVSGIGLRGCVVESGRLQELFEALAQAGKMDCIGAPLLQKLREAKAPIDRRVLTQLLSH